VSEEQTHIDTQDARAGTTPHIVRYVLGVSLVLAIVALLIVTLWGGN